MVKKSIVIVMQGLQILFIVAIMQSYTHAVQSISTQAEQAYLVDDQNGSVLFQKNAKVPISPGTLTKLMVIYVVLDALSAGHIEENSIITINANDIQKSRKKGATSMFLEVNNKVSVIELLQGLMVNLGNDAASALARGVMGSEENFIEAMNTKATEIGMRNTYFISVVGDAPEYEQYTTVQDLSFLARALLQNHSKYMTYFAQTTYTYNNIRQYNRNALLRGRLNVDGFMAGYSPESKYNIIATAFNENMRIIAILSGLPSLDAQKKESTKLLTWGLYHFHNISIFDRNVIIGKIPVLNANNNSMTIRTPKKISITVPKEIRKEQIKVHLEYKAPLQAPIPAGTTIAEIKIINPEAKYNSLIPITIRQDIDRANLLKRILYAWPNIFYWLWYKII